MTYLSRKNLVILFFFGFLVLFPKGTLFAETIGTCNSSITREPQESITDAQKDTLCTSGMLSQFSGTGPWTWKCLADDPTKDAPCVAQKKTVATLSDSGNSISGIDPACIDNPDNCYAFFSGFGDLLDQKVATFTEVDSLGSFLNRIIGFGIAVGGVIAVVMIMYTGYQYMSTDNTNTKGEMRSKMVNTVVGFLLLLSIYTILRTINPDLLNLTPGIDIATLKNIENLAPRTSNGTPILTGGGDSSSSNDVLRINKNISEYDAFFKKYSSKYNKDCTLLKATMYRESGGNPNAKSPVGAVGLMQFMPTTAQGLGYSTNDMFNPEKAIEASAKYYQSLSKYGCNGKPSSNVCDASRPKYTTAAYNGGPGANKTSNSCIGKTIWECELNNGYKETRHYSATVLANYQTLKDKGWACN